MQSPYAIRWNDGRILDHLSWQNADEAVRLNRATWIDYDAALVAISAARAAERVHFTVNAMDVR